MSDARELQLRTDLVYKDKLIENLTKIGTHQDNFIKMSNEQIKIYEEKVQHAESFSAWEKALYFGLGAALTGAVAYGAVRAVR